MAITIKNEREIGKMQQAGHVVAVCHQRISQAIEPGVTTAELDTLVRDTIVEFDAKSNFFGHQGFPSYICASTNDEIVHGFPGKRILRDGDIIAVDIGAIVDGWHGDSAWTYGVGQISDEAARLLRDTEASLYEGIGQAVAANRIGDIEHAVQQFAEARGLGIVEQYGGHGIGRQMWEDPHIPNYGVAGHGIMLRPGMTLAIEPMLTLGSEKTKVLKDKWTVATIDGSWSAHFEHTVAITKGAPIILTERLPVVV